MKKKRKEKEIVNERDKRGRAYRDVEMQMIR